MLINNGNYEVIVTGDGSPSLRDLRGANLETMHHRGGAYSETQEIYGKLVRYCLERQWFSFVSVGLGLGYNELLVAAEVFRTQINPALIRLRSFESDNFLKEAFQNFVLEAPQSSDIYCEVVESFEKDPRFGGPTQGPTRQELCNILSQWLRSGQWKIDEALTDSTVWGYCYHGIIYDAYSSKTNPELWQEEFLKNFFNSACCSEAAVSTYACTGALKRSLAANGFRVDRLPGFSNKKNSIFAVRG